MRIFTLISIACILTSCQPPPAEEKPASKAAPASPSSLADHDPQVEEILARMTLEEKIGQMTQADLPALVEESDVQTYFLGSVLSGGNSDPTPENTFEDWRNAYQRLQNLALKTRLGIPILYGIDAVHGHSNVVGAVIFPHNIGLGATRDAELVEKVYRATAVEVRATGINWNFAPCLTVVRDERWGRTYEGFSEDPDLVTELGEAAVRGLQGQGLGDPLGVLACAKHFVGDGGTTFGTGHVDQEGKRFPLDRGDTRLEEAELRRIHIAPYRAAIQAGVGTIMPSYSSWNGVKSSGHKDLLTDILKREMGFEGFLISDWAAIDEIPGDYKSDVEQSINAGMDMVMVPDKYREFIATLKELVEEEKVPMSRIDDAVRRILRVKFAMGLLDAERSHLADPALAERFGSDEHRQLAREAVRRSLVLLKNDNAVLPLSKELGRIHVAGKNADDLGHQCGGWTIAWQGGSGEITEGTTILEAIRATVSAETEVTYSQDGSLAEGADLGVVIVGESPYAEMMGDRDDLTLDAGDAAAIKKVSETGIPTVVLVVSGRPLILGDSLDAADALVAAWLPGSEGQGVADVLFGDVAPTGKLPFSWPRTMDQVPMNVGDVEYDPLFAFGFSLSY